MSGVLRDIHLDTESSLENRYDTPNGYHDKQSNGRPEYMIPPLYPALTFTRVFNKNKHSVDKVKHCYCKEKLDRRIEYDCSKLLHDRQFER